MSDKIKTGVKGENLAADFLVGKGFEILVRNFRYKRGEIDLIVRRDDWLVFVEVKARSSTDFGEPEAFVTPSQASRIFEAAEEFIFRCDWQGHVRFDVVSIKTIGDTPEIEYFEDAIN